ncbi:MAG: sterol desaturase family protein [Bacteroidota bacterium]
MEAYAKVLTYAIPGFLLLIIIESLVARWRGMQINRAMDTISSLSSGMTNTLKALMGLSIVIISYDWMHQRLALFEIESTVWLVVLAFIGHDFAGYWSHRFNHMVNLFWNRHIVHHSSEEFNLSCALRQTISAIVGIYFFLYIPMAIIGVPPLIVAIVAPIHLFAQFWYHTRLIDRMGFLEHIIVTPSHHRVHHAINEEYIDKNFSEVFIVWDKWFGTFQEELPEVPPVYGTKKPAATWNPILINYMHLWQLIKDAWRTRSWRDKLRIWFMPTGWRPVDVAQKHPVQIVTDVYARTKYDTPASPFLRNWSWAQLLIHNLLMYYILVHIASFEFTEVLLYASFLMLSIFAYTTLMDRHPWAFGIEALKLLAGLLLIWYMGGWYGLDNYLSGGTYLIVGYLLISTVLTIYFSWFETSGADEITISSRI